MKLSICTALIAAAIFGSKLVSAAEMYVAKDGNDSNTGTQLSPYLTLAHAASVAVAGDQVIIREGTYEETLKPLHSGTASAPIVFRAFEGEKVIISAMQSLSDFTSHEGLIYSTEVDWDLGQQNFVMQGDTVLDLARWPNNVDGDPWTQNSLRSTGGTDDLGDKTVLEYSLGIPDFDWSNGGSMYFYGDRPGSGWLTWRAYITASSSNSVTVDVSNKSPSWIVGAHPPVDGGDFWLQGIYEALDYENEWYLDSATQILYVQLPEGAAPLDGQVSMRKRELTVDLRDRDYIEIRNLAVFGGAIELTSGADNNLIYGVTSLYGNHTLGVARTFYAESQSINIDGNNNRIEKSEIGHGAGTGIWDSGDGTEIINNFIHDFNTLGDYDALIMARGGNYTKVQGNLLTRAGRSGVQSINRYAEYAYNDFSRSNLIADDCALFYTLGGPLHTEIHHNWFHDTYSSGTKKKAAGIYLDNDSHTVSVHHNVVWNTEWTNIQINWDGTNIDIYNNTLLTGSAVMGAWHKEGTAFSDVNVWNNLSDDTNWEPQSDQQNNVSETTIPFINSDEKQFVPTNGSVAHDQGLSIDGITDDVSDGSPDVGAYELGGSNQNWTPGIDWDYKRGPTGYGCYGLPGEECIEEGNTEPEIPVDPEEPTDPEVPTDPETPAEPDTPADSGSSSLWWVMFLLLSVLIRKYRDQ